MAGAASKISKSASIKKPNEIKASVLSPGGLGDGDGERPFDAQHLSDVDGVGRDESDVDGMATPTAGAHSACAAAVCCPALVLTWC